MTKIKTGQPDYNLIITVFVLVVFGLIMLASASSALSYQYFGYNYYYFRHQLLYGIGGGVIFFILASKINYQYWKKLAIPFLFVTIVLLILTLLPGIGFQYGGAKRWIIIGPISVQPAEIAKLTSLIYLSTWLIRKKEGLADWRKGFLPFLVILGVIGFLIILQPDIGTMFVICLSAVIIYFVAGAKVSHLFALGAAGVALFFILIKTAPYRMARFLVYLNPKLDPQGIGYHISQALLAIGSGGILGRGLGKSIQKHLYLPEIISDSIFAIIAEELGFIRTIMLLALFVIFGYLGFKIARQIQDNFGKLLATGITSWICFQALINIAAIVGLIPLTGIPLPFISYGGSALVTSLCAVGILVNISKHIQKSLKE